MNQVKNFCSEMGVTDIKEKKKLIHEIKGKTTKETEKILWEKRDLNLPRKITIALKEDTIQAMDKLKGLKAHTCPDYDSLIMKMIEFASKEWDPTVVYRKRSLGKESSRYIQKSVKASVWERDKGKCAQCGSCYVLQLDHIRPYALGGKSSSENLQLLCRNCNQRKGSGRFTLNHKNSNIFS